MKRAFLAGFCGILAGWGTGCAPAPDGPQLGTTVYVAVQTPAGPALRLASATVKVVNEPALDDALAVAVTRLVGNQRLLDSLAGDFFQSLAPAPGTEILKTDAEGRATIPKLMPGQLVAVLGTHSAGSETVPDLWIMAAEETQKGRLMLGNQNRGGEHLTQVLGARPQARRALARGFLAEADRKLVQGQFESARRLVREARSWGEPDKAEAILWEIDRQQVAALRRQATAAMAARDFGGARALAEQMQGLDSQQAREILRQILEFEGGEIRSFTGHDGPVNSVALNAAGTLALSGSDDRTIKLWDMVSGRGVRTFVGHKQAVTSVCFSPDGRSVLSGSSDGTIRLWDLEKGEPIREFGGLGWKVTSVAFSPDGRLFASAGDDNKVKLWELGNLREIRVFTGHGWKVNGVAFSPNGRYLLSGSDDDTARLWDVATGQELRRLSHGFVHITTVAFSPDGRYALTGSADKTIKLWEVATGQEVKTIQPFRGHTAAVRSATFSPDGRFILSGSDDGSIRLWDVARVNVMVPTLTGHAGPVTSVVYGGDGKTVLSGSADKTLKLWQLPRDSWPQTESATPIPPPASK